MAYADYVQVHAQPVPAASVNQLKWKRGGKLAILSAGAIKQRRPGAADFLSGGEGNLVQPLRYSPSTPPTTWCCFPRVRPATAPRHPHSQPPKPQPPQPASGFAHLERPYTGSFTSVREALEEVQLETSLARRRAALEKKRSRARLAPDWIEVHDKEDLRLRKAIAEGRAVGARRRPPSAQPRLMSSGFDARLEVNAPNDLDEACLLYSSPRHIASIGPRTQLNEMRARSPSPPASPTASRRAGNFGSRSASPTPSASIRPSSGGVGERQMLAKHASSPAFTFGRSPRDRPVFGKGAYILSFDHLKGNGVMVAD